MQKTRKKRGRIPRRWVLLTEDGKPFAFPKVRRSLIRKIERVASIHGWDFETAVKELLARGLGLCLESLSAQGVEPDVAR